MRNYEKKLRKIIFSSAAVGLILSFSLASYATYWIEPDPDDEEDETIIVSPGGTGTMEPETEAETETQTEPESAAIETIPPEEYTTTTEELPSPIVVVTTARTSDTDDMVDPFNPVTDRTETDNSQSVETTPDTGGITETGPNTSDSDVSTPDSSDTEPTSSEAPAPVLSLTYYTFNLEIGQEVQLYWWVENGSYNGAAARYYSDNTSVASVSDSGVITARGAGRANITVTVGELTASAVVNVAAPAAEAQALSVLEKSYNLKIGESVYVQAAILPEEAAWRYSIIFSSDNPEVAEVDENGIITARSAGEAYITVACSGTNFSETVYVAVTNEEMIYEKARLTGCLYDSVGNPAGGVLLTADNVSAVTDKNGYFVFDALDRKDIVIRITENELAACVFGLNADSTVCLLYGESSLECFYSYEEMAARFAVSEVSFETSSKRVYVGDVYIPYYQYEPRNASVTQVLYISSDENIASVDQNGVITAKSIGEAIITLVLNGGQAQTFFTLTVSPEETGKYTAVIAAAETAVILAGAAAAAIIYKRYRKKSGDAVEDEEDY